MLPRTLALLLWMAPLLPAEVAGLRIVERSPVLNGATFGETGAYERVLAKAHFAVDPDAPANAGIADIGAAPRNAQGTVEFSADVYSLKPARPQRGSGTILFEVSNRGGKGLMRFNRAENPGARDPRSPADFGDGFLFKRGYTLVWVGWQFDLLEREHALRLEAPAAEGAAGRTRSHFSPSAPAASFSVAGRGHKPYAAADPADPGAKLIVRGYPDGPGREIPRKRWRFLDPQTVALDGGFAAGKTYDVVYRAKNPGIAGLGAAAIRDFVSWLKFDNEGGQGELADLRAALDRAIAFGSSQSGRFLRTFLYEGFNADERGRRVFDGVWPHIAGAARGSFTHRFAFGLPRLAIVLPTGHTLGVGFAQVSQHRFHGVLGIGVAGEVGAVGVGMVTAFVVSGYRAGLAGADGVGRYAFRRQLGVAVRRPNLDLVGVFALVMNSLFQHS